MYTSAPSLYQMGANARTVRGSIQKLLAWAVDCASNIGVLAKANVPLSANQGLIPDFDFQIDMNLWSSLRVKLQPVKEL
jgi:hypothetical protein